MSSRTPTVRRSSSDTALDNARRPQFRSGADRLSRISGGVAAVERPRSPGARDYSEHPPEVAALLRSEILISQPPQQPDQFSPKRHLSGVRSVGSKEIQELKNRYSARATAVDDLDDEPPPELVQSPPRQPSPHSYTNYPTEVQALLGHEPQHLPSAQPTMDFRTSPPAHSAVHFGAESVDNVESSSDQFLMAIAEPADSRGWEAAPADSQGLKTQNWMQGLLQSEQDKVQRLEELLHLARDELTESRRSAQKWQQRAVTAEEASAAAAQLLLDRTQLLEDLEQEQRQSGELKANTMALEGEIKNLQTAR